jgi:hypothetical protein
MELLTPGGIDLFAEVDEGGHAVTPNPTEDDLLEALTAMERGDIEYVIVQDGQTGPFMQAAGDASSGYVLEYTNGQDDTFYAARGDVSGTLVTEALGAFLNRDAAWRTMVVWDKKTNRY